MDSKKSIKLLVVDDQDDYYDMLTEYADICKHEYNIQCEHALSGKEAQEKIKDWHPTIILLDVHIPDINGFELLEEIKHGQAPVVIASDAPSKGVEESAKRNGARGYILKSYNPEEMDALLQYIATVASDNNELQ